MFFEEIVTKDSPMIKTIVRANIYNWSQQWTNVCIYPLSIPHIPCNHSNTKAFYRGIMMVVSVILLANQTSVFT